MSMKTERCILTINKAFERFEGLSDATDKTADRATKTPHVDSSNLSLDNATVN